MLKIFQRDQNNFYIITQYLHSYMTITNFDKNYENITVEDYSEIFQNLCSGMKILQSIGYIGI